jgi:hypothetical protein
MNIPSSATMFAAAICFLAGPAAAAPLEPQSQSQSQAQPSGEAPPAGKKRSIVIPTNPGNSAIQSAVTSARDDATRRTKGRQPR